MELGNYKGEIDLGWVIGFIPQTRFDEGRRVLVDLEGAQLLRIPSDVPRGNGELHRRHERVHLRPPHEELRVRLVAKVRVPANNVRKGKGVAEDT